jgi:hypothetical protein
VLTGKMTTAEGSSTSRPQDAFKPALEQELRADGADTEQHPRQFNDFIAGPPRLVASQTK